MSIINNGTFETGGEHWVACIKQKNDTYMYDSFARDSETLSNHFPRHWIETDEDVEQFLLEQNCGARCIAWLCCCVMFGVKETAKVI